MVRGANLSRQTALLSLPISLFAEQLSNRTVATTMTTLSNLNEQVTLLTGASSGIDLTTARMEAESRARLVLAARSEDALQLLARGAVVYARTHKRIKTASSGTMGSAPEVYL